MFFARLLEKARQTTFSGNGINQFNTRSRPARNMFVHCYEIERNSIALKHQAATVKKFRSHLLTSFILQGYYELYKEFDSRRRLK